MGSCSKQDVEVPLQRVRGDQGSGPGKRNQENAGNLTFVFFFTKSQ